MRLSGGLLALVLIVAIGAFNSPVRAAESTPPAQTAWRLLDYISVDYAGAVSNGQVTSAAEYAEMAEFSAEVRRRLASLPATPVQPGLIRQAETLQGAVDRKAPPAEVAALAKALGSDLLAAYPTPLAPSSPPDLARGAALYREQCAACHGASGAADGANAKGLNPPPIAFTDRTRADQRSVFGLYQVIGQGLDGTAMASFAHLPDHDRWALAFYVGRFAYPEPDAARGERLWRADPRLREAIPNMQALTQVTPASLAGRTGAADAAALTAYLRRHPEAMAAAPSGSLAVARARLRESVQAYEGGDRRRATDLALAAYLDGFEPIEPVLSARDPGLLRRVEGAMTEFRAAINRGARPAEVRTQAERLGALFDATERALSAEKASAASSFAGALTILLREGLEALLIVVAMIAFLRKAERTDVLPYVHAGWVGALGAGALTWWAATYLISISGASREFTEGFGSLLAAVVLVSVGIWMHGKGQADAWQKYVRDKLSHALSRRSAWFLFALAFVVVYREVFETILFFTALWSQGGGVAMLAGAGVAVSLLALAAWALLSYSRRLPIAKFFSFSSLLIAGLAVVLAGKGVAGLQEAGLLDVRPLAAAPRIEILGLYPTWEGVLAQVLTIAAMIVGFWYTSRPAPTRR